MIQRGLVKVLKLTQGALSEIINFQAHGSQGWWWGGSSFSSQKKNILESKVNPEKMEGERDPGNVV